MPELGGSAVGNADLPGDGLAGMRDVPNDIALVIVAPAVTVAVPVYSPTSPVTNAENVYAPGRTLGMVNVPSGPALAQYW